MDLPGSLSKKNLFLTLGLLLILVSIPLTLFILRREQRAVPRAALPEEECRVYADVVLVVDMSTTMTQSLDGGTRKSAAISAARSFLDVMDLEDEDGDGQRDRIGVVQFNRNAKTLSNLTSNRQQLDSALDQLQTSEFTAINKGLDEAKEVLENSPPPAQERFVLLLTDGELNIHPDERGGVDQLDTLETSTDSLKQIGEIYAIHFAKNEEHLGHDLLANHVVSQPVDQHLIHAGLNTPDLESAFIRSAGLIKECPCTFSITAQVENVNTDEILEERGFRGFGELNGEPQETIDYYEEPPEGSTQVNYTPVNLPEALRGSSAASNLNTIPDNYRLVERFCYDRGTAVGCPPNLTGDQTISGGASSDRIEGFLYSCGADITYGWRVQEYCPFESTVQVKIRENGQESLLTNVSGFSTESIANGGTPQVNDLPSTGQVSRDFPTENLPEQFRDTEDDVSVTLNQEGEASGYRIVDTFCTGGSGCPDLKTNPNDPTINELTGFDLECNYDITYGWVVEKIPEEAYCYQRTCQDKQALEGQGVNTSNLTVCGVSEIGTSPEKCETSYCVETTNVCETTAVEDKPTGARSCEGDLDCQTVCDTSSVASCVIASTIPAGDRGQSCTTDEECARGTPTHLECVGLACQEVEGAGQNECSTPADPSDECSVSVCVDDNNDGTDDACRAFPKDDPPAGQTCETLADCEPDTTTYFDCDYELEQCVEKTTAGEIPSDAVDCGGDDSICQTHTECRSDFTCATIGGPGEDECTFDKDCVPTYSTCDQGACVEKVGDKESTCDPDIPNECKPQCEGEDCIPTGIDGAAFTVTVGAVILFLAGLALMF